MSISHIPDIVKEFIEEHIDLIESNKFQEVYDEIDEVVTLLGGFNTCDFTEVLLDAGIDPMPYLTNIPQEYLYFSQKIKDTLRIPSNIELIGKDAFSMCPWIHTVVIEEGCKIIDEEAFANMPKLKSVKLPNSLVSISNSAFDNNTKVKIICPSGSHAEEWAKKRNHPTLILRNKIYR